MAFPQIRSQSNGKSANVGATSHSVVLPATVVAGDVLLIGFALDGSTAPTWDNSTAGTWTQIGSRLGGDGTSRVMYYKVASGTEDGLTLTITTPTETAVWKCWAFSGASGNVESATVLDGGSSASPDPANLAPSWGAKDTTWVVFGASGNSSSTASAYPSGYTNTGTDGAGFGAGGGIAAWWATKEANASSENPGTATIAVADFWSIFTVGLEPAASVTLTDVDTDETITTGQTGIAYTGSGLTNADGLVVTFAAREAAATAFVATNATSGTFTAPSLSAVLSAGVKFGSVTFQIEDGGVSLATLAGTLNPESGWQVHNVTDISQAADTGCIYNGQSPAVAVGDQILFESTGVTIDSQGFVTLDGVSQFDYYVWDDTDDTWGAMGTFSGVGSGDALLRPILRPALLPIMKPILH